MYLVEVFLPLSDNDGWTVGNAQVEQVRQLLYRKFGDLTAQSRSSALGYSREGKSNEKDDHLVLGVTVPEIDRAWWDVFKKNTEKQFRQSEILIRATELARL